jgi:phenol 2-monooxygenase
MLVNKHADQSLAEKLAIGERIPSVKVLNQSDARPWHLHELLPCNGRWRVLVFPVGAAFEGSILEGPAFEVLAIHGAKRTDVTIFDFPLVFRRFDEIEGWDYGKIFVDDDSYHEGHGQIYREFGIEDGCIVIVRPDQHVSYVGSL